MRVKNLLPVILAGILATSFKTADKNPVGFTVTVSNIHPSVGDEIELIFTANLPEHTHLYSEKTTCLPYDGPILPEFRYSDSSGMAFDYNINGIGDTLILDEAFGCSSGQFFGKAEFRQKIRVTGPISDFSVNFTGQLCQDDGRCFMVEEKIKMPSIQVSMQPKDGGSKW